MIALFRRRLDVKNKKAEQLAIMPRTNVKVTYVYGRAVLHLNASQLDAKYLYWLTLSRDDALALWAELDTFLNSTGATTDETAIGEEP